MLLRECNVAAVLATRVPCELYSRTQTKNRRTFFQLFFFFSLGTNRKGTCHTNLSHQHPPITMTTSWNIKFVPFSSSFDSPFWVRYNKEKLENIRLSEEPISLTASYGTAQCLLECTESSLETAKIPNERIAMTGLMKGYNTLEAFQQADKNAAIRDRFCKTLFEDTGVTASNFNTFLLLTFADLKNHRVLYWLGVPALLPKQSIQAVKQILLSDQWKEEEQRQVFDSLTKLRRSCKTGLPPFFVYDTLTGICQCLEDHQEALHIDNLVFGFFDPVAQQAVGAIGPQEPMGWPLRNLVAYLSLRMGLGGKEVSILSYRLKRLRRLEENTEDIYDSSLDANSIFLRVKIPEAADYEWEGDQKYKVVGWELNARGKPGPRWVNLKPLLDSKHLAIQAADLNLKLMKWRMLPGLQVDMLQSRKVLLLGAGTLGCNVARVLLGWGVRNFTFVDYGKVSYSNPVRQSLFTLEDCHYDNGSGKPKAVAAAKALSTIAADVEAKGVVLSIPMPGHPEDPASVADAVHQLDQMMQDCDVAFVLTDTRESRWLPTIMAAAHDKIMINSALGLDSWLVMRHGGGYGTGRQPRYGCYFCNDVVAPEDSTRNRTLDQQCTVTRPGLALIAASMAVEVMVSLLHHPDGLAAPAPQSNHGTFSASAAAEESSVLGVIPHQCRGSLVSFTMMTPTVPAFSCCTGCSPVVIEAYQKDKVELVTKTCESASYLETLSGLAEFKAQSAKQMEGMEDWDDEDVDAE